MTAAALLSLQDNSGTLPPVAVPTSSASVARSAPPRSLPAVLEGPATPGDLRLDAMDQPGRGVVASACCRHTTPHMHTEPHAHVHTPVAPYFPLPLYCNRPMPTVLPKCRAWHDHWWGLWSACVARVTSLPPSYCVCPTRCGRLPPRLGGHDTAHPPLQRGPALSHRHVHHPRGVCG